MWQNVRFRTSARPLTGHGTSNLDLNHHHLSLPTFGQTQIPGWRNPAKTCRSGAMDSHRAADRHMLSHHDRRFLSAQRVGHLATADGSAIPHVVPVCFTISQGTLYITIDEQPKRVSGAALKRVRNIERNPMVAIVVDRYDEDWTRLGWVMLQGRAEILRAGTE